MRWVWFNLDGMGLMEGRRVRAGCVKVGVTELAAERNGRGRKCSRVKKGREMLKFLECNDFFPARVGEMFDRVVSFQVFFFPTLPPPPASPESVLVLFTQSNWACYSCPEAASWRACGRIVLLDGNRPTGGAAESGGSIGRPKDWGRNFRETFQKVCPERRWRGGAGEGLKVSLGAAWRSRKVGESFQASKAKVAEGKDRRRWRGRL